MQNILEVVRMMRAELRRSDRKVADQVVFMDEGRVIEAGTPAAIFDTPKSPRLKHFLAEVL